MVTADLPKIRLFGEPVLQTPDGERLPFRTLKVPALLGYLVARGGRPSPRAEIAEALWPDRQAAPALQNLRQTLLYLRGLLGDALLHANRREVRLETGLADCDVESFRSALPTDPERAVALYAGPFLAGFDDAWVLPLRAELSHGYVKALLALSDRDLGVDPAAALDWAERAIAEEPFHDGARARKIRALRRLGEETRALREFEAYESLLDEELGLRPATIVEDALSDRSPSTVPRPRPDRASTSNDFTDALRLLSEGERPQDGVRLAVSLSPYWMEVGTPREGLRRLDAAWERWTDRSDRVLAAQACLAAGNLAQRIGDMTRAVAEAEFAHAASDGPVERVASMVLLAGLLARRRETPQARRTALGAARLARASSIPAGEAWVAVAVVHGQDGRAVRTVAAARRARATAGSRRTLADAGILLSEGYGMIGQTDLARKSLREGVEALGTDHSYETTAIRAHAARQFEELGDLPRAAQGYEECIAEYRHREDQWGLAVTLTYLADLKTERGEAAAAIPLHEEARAIRAEAGEAMGEATSLRGLGAAHLSLGNHEAARGFFREAVRRYAEVDWNPGIASCLLPLARAEAALGARSLARRLALRAIGLLKSMSPGTRLNIGPRGGELLPEAERFVGELSA